MSSDIKPRIDKDGVGWCAQCNDCPHWDETEASEFDDPVDNDLCATVMMGTRMVCPVHARRVAQWAEDVLAILDAAQDQFHQIIVPIYWRIKFRRLIRTHPGAKGGE